MIDVSGASREELIAELRSLHREVREVREQRDRLAEKVRELEQKDAARKLQDVGRGFGSLGDLFGGGSA